MKSGYRVVDMDSHVNPGYNVLEKYVDPDFRPRLDEFEPYKTYRTLNDGSTLVNLSVANPPYNRQPHTPLLPEHDTPKHGTRVSFTAPVNEKGLIAHLRVAPHPGISDENVDGRIEDMDLEGMDVNFLYPGTWVTTVSGLDDVTLSEGLYRGYHNYIKTYCSKYPKRLKGMAVVPGADPEWAVSEVKRMANEEWLSAVWPILKEGLAIDDPSLDPLWEVMNDLHLPIVHHSFFFEPPYFPGYRDIWGNAVVARTAAHPWGAERLLSYIIISGMFDRYPNLNCAVAEVGHGWLPHWVIRLGEMIYYVTGMTPPLKYKPLEYVQMGRFKAAAEPMEGPDMTKACYDILGDKALMHQSDFPHPEAHFPDTAGMVIDWPIWKGLGEEALVRHMSKNADEFLRWN